MGLAVVRLGEARRYHCQSLEFLAETRILAEMKIENHEQNISRGKKIDKHTFFPMKIKNDESVNAKLKVQN